MTPAIEAEDGHTGDELDAIEVLVASDGYAILMGRVDLELERQRKSLEWPSTAEETAACRGQIAALRMVRSLPGILREEITKEGIHGR